MVEGSLIEETTEELKNRKMEFSICLSVEKETKLASLGLAAICRADFFCKRGFVLVGSFWLQPFLSFWS
jgi:hypothetical protein